MHPGAHFIDWLGAAERAGSLASDWHADAGWWCDGDAYPDAYEHAIWCNSYSYSNAYEYALWCHGDAHADANEYACFADEHPDAYQHAFRHDLLAGLECEHGLYGWGAGELQRGELSGGVLDAGAAAGFVQWAAWQWSALDTDGVLWWWHQPDPYADQCANEYPCPCDGHAHPDAYQYAFWCNGYSYAYSYAYEYPCASNEYANFLGEWRCMCYAVGVY